MSFELITAEELASDPSGVRAFFPRYNFTPTSVPLNTTHLGAYCQSALVDVRQLIRSKGYRAEQVSAPDDVSTLRMLAVYHVAATVEGVLDGGKDFRTEKRFSDLHANLLKRIEDDPTPFSVPNETTSDPQPFHPTRIVRDPDACTLPDPGYLRWIYTEVPSGTVDGSNRAFLLSRAPDPPDSLLLTLNGLAQTFGAHYTVAGRTITTSTAPSLGATLVALRYSYVG
jgi:hypothetical protein